MMSIIVRDKPGVENDAVCGTTKSYSASSNIFSDNNNFCGVISGGTATTSNNLPDIVFNGEVKSGAGSLSYVWNPGSLPGYSVYSFFPSTTPTSTYTVTASVPGANRNDLLVRPSSNINIAVNPKQCNYADQ